MREYCVKLVTRGGLTRFPVVASIRAIGPWAATPMKAAVEVLTPWIGRTADGISCM